MSLLDKATDTVVFYVQTAVSDSYGQSVLIPSYTPTSIDGRVQPATSDELAALGQVSSTLKRFIARSMPQGPYARMEWDGREWDAVGEPDVYHGSALTAHMAILMRSRDGVTD